MQARWILIALAAAVAMPAAETTAQQPARVVQIGQSGWLGFSYSTGWPDGDARVVVDTVIPQSPAARAGMQKADTVMEVNGLRATPRLLGSLGLEPGDRVELTVRRNGSERTLSLTAAERPEGYGMTNVYTIRTDSVLPMVRGMLDSALIRIDSLKFPQIHFRTIHDSAGRTVIIRGRGEDVDTLRFEFDTDSLFQHFELFGDSMRHAMDSVFLRVARPGMQVHIHGDSVVVLGDSMGVRGIRPFMYRSGDMDFDFDAAPFRIAHVGFTSIAGMQLEELDDGLGAYFGTDSGLLVLEVGEDTPAERAGLREGDVILRANGQDVERISQLRREIARTDEDEVELRVLRERREITLELRIDD